MLFDRSQDKLLAVKRLSKILNKFILQNLSYLELISGFEGATTISYVKIGVNNYDKITKITSKSIKNARIRDSQSKLIYNQLRQLQTSFKIRCP